MLSIWWRIFSCNAKSSSSDKFWRHLISITVKTISLLFVWKSTNRLSARSCDFASISRNNSWWRSIGIINESETSPFFRSIRFIKVVPNTSKALFLVLPSCIIMLLETERISAKSSKNDSLSLRLMPKLLKWGTNNPSISDVGLQVRNDDIPFNSTPGR